MSRAKNRLKRPLVLVFTPILILLFLVLIALFNAPMIVKTFGEKGLVEAGFLSGTIRDIDIDWKTGKVTVSDLVAKGENDREAGFKRFSALWDWGDVFDWNMRLREVDITGLALTLEQDGDQWLLSGLSLKGSGQEAETPSTFDGGLDHLILHDTQVTVVRGTHRDKLKIDQLDVRNITARPNDNPVETSWKADLNGFEIVGSAVLKRGPNDDQASLQLKLDGVDSALLGTVPELSETVSNVSGRFDLRVNADVSQKETQTVITVSKSQIKWSEGARVTLLGQEKPIDLQFSSAQINLEGADVHPGRETVTLKNFDVELNGLSVNLNVDGQEPYTVGHIKTVGQLALDGAEKKTATIDATLNASDIIAGPASVQTIRIVPKAQLSEDGIHVEGALDVSTLKVKQEDQEVVEAIGINAEQFVFEDKEGVSSPQIKVVGLNVLKGDQNPFSLASQILNLSDFSFHQERGLRVSSVAPSGLMISIRKPAGEPKTSVESTADNQDQIADMLPFPVRIGQLVTQGDASLQWTDPTLKPAVKATLKDVSLSVREIDSRYPKSYSFFDVDGKLTSFGSIAANGRIRPFDPLTSGAVKASIQDVDVATLQGYIVQYLGVAAKTGSINVESDVTLTDKKINAGVDVQLNGFKVDDSSKEKNPQVNGMPLIAGLNLLKDKNGNIKLKVPVSGDLENPKFDISDAVEQSVSKVLVTGVTTTLKVLFPPAAIGGAVVDLFSFVNDQATFGVPPVTFVPGSLEFAESQDTKRLNHMARLLVDHPNVNVEVCGIATDADMSETVVEDEDLQQMATERAAMAKGAILKMDKSIKGNRILICQRVIHGENAGAPRVEFAIQ